MSEEPSRPRRRVARAWLSLRYRIRSASGDPAFRRCQEAGPEPDGLILCLDREGLTCPATNDWHNHTSRVVDGHED